MNQSFEVCKHSASRNYILYRSSAEAYISPDNKVQIMDAVAVALRVARDPFYSLIPAWMSNHMSSKAWDEITYPFPNINGCAIDVWKWIKYIVPYFIMDVITYTCWY